MRADEMDTPSPSQLDFVPRDRRNESFKLVVAFLLVIGLILLLGYVPGLNDLSYAPLACAAMIGLLGWHVVPRYQRSLDLVLFTEYQNLLFSQSLALGANFCLIVKRDGAIAYANDGLKKTFGHGGYGDTLSLPTILERSGIALPDRERILGSIYNHLADRVVFPLATGHDTSKRYILTIEPLARPSGYTLVRGREFQEPRTDTPMMPTMLRATSADKLGHLLDHTPIPHYATDAFGRFEYVNQAFEDCLGFSHREILSSRMNLTTILFEIDDKPVSSDYQLADYRGAATLQDKKGDTLNARLVQRVIRDTKGKVTGATGSILLTDTTHDR